MSAELIWLIVGFAGQALFMMRFVLQWISSEKARRSVLPPAFWHYSLAGAVVLLAYAIHKQDPVFIAAQALGAIIYLRNLWLDYVARHRSAADAEKEKAP